MKGDGLAVARGDTVPLRDIVRARNRRRRELQGILQNRRDAVDLLMNLNRGSTRPDQTEKAHASSAAGPKTRSEPPRENLQCRGDGCHRPNDSRQLSPAEPTSNSGQIV